MNSILTLLSKVLRVIFLQDTMCVSDDDLSAIVLLTKEQEFTLSLMNSIDDFFDWERNSKGVYRYFLEDFLYFALSHFCCNLETSSKTLIGAVKDCLFLFLNVQNTCTNLICFYVIVINKENIAVFFYSKQLFIHLYVLSMLETFRV